MARSADALRGLAELRKALALRGKNAQKRLKRLSQSDRAMRGAHDVGSGRGWTLRVEKRLWKGARDRPRQGSKSIAALARCLHGIDTETEFVC
jgi:hypothetical protein